MKNYTTENAIEFFLNNAKNAQHGNSTYIEHCLGVYNILREFGAPDEVCLAGLYHSAYGTESFQPSLEITREQLLNLIGLHGEFLVHSFCTMENRDQTLLSLDQKDELFFIAYANLKEQSKRNQDQELHTLVAQYEEKLDNITIKSDKKDVLEIPTFNPQGVDVEHIELDDKDIFVFDNIIERNHLDQLNTYCLNSKYVCDHSSSPLNVELDSRFVSPMSDQEFLETGLEKTIKQICNVTGFNLHLGNYYINHYSILTNVSRHTDSSLPNTWTVLVFCNKYWDDAWGGEIKFYSEKSKLHSTVDFLPGRVILFDSRLEHKVLPLTGIAKKSRFTIAIKCASEEGLDNLISMYGTRNLIKFK